MDNILVGNSTIRNQNNNGATVAVIDSGTTFILLEETIYNSLKHHFQQNFCNISWICTNPSIFSDK